MAEAFGLRDAIGLPGLRVLADPGVDQPRAGGLDPDGQQVFGGVLLVRVHVGDGADRPCRAVGQGIGPGAPYRSADDGRIGLADPSPDQLRTGPAGEVHDRGTDRGQLEVDDPAGDVPYRRDHDVVARHGFEDLLDDARPPARVGVDPWRAMGAADGRGVWGRVQEHLVRDLVEPPRRGQLRRLQRGDHRGRHGADVRALLGGAQPQMSVGLVDPATDPPGQQPRRPLALQVRAQARLVDFDVEFDQALQVSVVGFHQPRSLRSCDRPKTSEYPHNRAGRGHSRWDSRPGSPRRSRRRPASPAPTRRCPRSRERSPRPGRPVPSPAAGH